MKLITAIAALALVAGSMDVEAQKRGDANKKSGGEEGKPQIGPLVHIAGGFFGELYPDERGDLIDEAKSGDGEAQKALIADDIAGLKEVLEGLEDAETLKWIKFGMLIDAASPGDKFLRLEGLDERLDVVTENLRTSLATLVSSDTYGIGDKTWNE